MFERAQGVFEFGDLRIDLSEIRARPLFAPLKDTFRYGLVDLPLGCRFLFTDGPDRVAQGPFRAQEGIDLAHCLDLLAQAGARLCAKLPDSSFAFAPHLTVTDAGQMSQNFAVVQAQQISHGGFGYCPRIEIGTQI
ncbi:hypothetical protein [Parasphingorhabdus sp.]|uniref:hypothetical protein n=1 Tax=Parasphingorhabdus sp. TaxID=2709688 RepID=UPI0030034B50